MADEPTSAYDIDLDQKTHISVPFPKHPPQLGVALLWAKPGRTPDCRSALEKAILAQKKKPVALSAADFETELPSLLEHILFRLTLGVWEAWTSKYGYHIRPPSRAPKESDDAYGARVEDYNLQRAGLGFLENSPDEQWARAVTQMFVFAPYMGSGGLVTGLGSTVKNDGIVFSAYPKVHSIGVACQHLSTYIALTRGIPFSEITPGMDASPMSNSSGFQAAPADALEKKSFPRPAWFDAPVSKWREYDLHPGDCVAGDDISKAQMDAWTAAVNAEVARAKAKKEPPKSVPAPTRGGFAHVASVIRRWPPNASPDAPYKLQWLDGALTTHAGNSTQDHDWCDAHGTDIVTKTFGPATYRRGFGRIKAATNLAAAADEALLALPLGFARLLIAQKDDWTVRYASGILPMWFDTCRFHISDYLWSLRELPAQGLVGIWIIYSSVGEGLMNEIAKEAAGPSRDADALFKAAAGCSLREVVVVTSEPRVYRADVHGNEKWAAYGPDAAGEEKEYDESADPDADSNAPGPMNVPKADTGGSAFRAWLPLRLGALEKNDAWTRLQKLDTASTEMRVPDLSKSGADGLKESDAMDGKVPYFNLTLK